MLHIVRPADLVASWGEQGWPTLLDANIEDLPEPTWLYWALSELGPAADHHDLPAIDDLLGEVALLLERLWTTAPGEHAAAFAPVSASLWGEIQRGRGAQDMTSIALHGRLLRNTTGPPRVGPRPLEVVPPYRAGAARVAGGRLPLAGQVADVDLAGDRDPTAVFLQLLAVVLSNRSGHLVDAAGGAPAGIEPGSVGWGPRPDGPLVGGVDQFDGEYAADAGSLLLRPELCVDAVNQVLAEAGSARSFTVDTVARGLAEAWLIDTTLHVGPQLRREFVVSARLSVDRDEEPVWRLPLAVFHPRQFPAPTLLGTPSGPHLRIIRTGEDH